MILCDMLAKPLGMVGARTLTLSLSFFLTTQISVSPELRSSYGLGPPQASSQQIFPQSRGLGGHRAHPLAAAGDQRGRTLARGTAGGAQSPIPRRPRPSSSSLPFRKSEELKEAEKSPPRSHRLGRGFSVLHPRHCERGHPLLLGCPVRGLRGRPLGSAHQSPAGPRSCDHRQRLQGGDSPWPAAELE